MNLSTAYDASWHPDRYNETQRHFAWQVLRRSMARCKLGGVRQRNARQGVARLVLWERAVEAGEVA